MPLAGLEAPVNFFSFRKVTFVIMKINYVTVRGCAADENKYKNLTNKQTPSFESPTAISFKIMTSDKMLKNDTNRQEKKI